MLIICTSFFCAVVTMVMEIVKMLHKHSESYIAQQLFKLPC